MDFGETPQPINSCGKKCAPEVCLNTSKAYHKSVCPLVFYYTKFCAGGRVRLNAPACRVGSPFAEPTEVQILPRAPTSIMREREVMPTWLAPTQLMRVQILPLLPTNSSWRINPKWQGRSLENCCASALESSSPSSSANFKREALPNWSWPCAANAAGLQSPCEFDSHRFRQKSKDEGGRMKDERKEERSFASLSSFRLHPSSLPLNP